MLKTIQNNQDRQRFEVSIDGHIGYMTYVFHENAIEYNHTIVPSTIGGRGVGSELVKYGLAFARVEHLQVIPSCPFVAAYMEKHEVYQDLLRTD